MSDKERRYLHPLPALKPSQAKEYAASTANLLGGFIVEDDHAIVLCEMDVEYRRMPSPERMKLLRFWLDN